jgi:hypothetical protein
MKAAKIERVRSREQIALGLHTSLASLFDLLV